MIEFVAGIVIGYLLLCAWVIWALNRHTRRTSAPSLRIVKEKP